MKVTDKSRQEIFELYKGSRVEMPKTARIHEMELHRIMSDIIRKMRRVELLICPDKHIRKYPLYLHIYEIDCSCWYQRGMEDFPEVLITNDGFEFRTAWFDLDIHDYFETLRDDAIWEIGDEIEKLRTQLKQKKKDFKKLGTMMLDIDVVNDTKIIKLKKKMSDTLNF